MELTFKDRIMHAWNAFTNKDPTNPYGPGSSTRPDRVKLFISNERSIITSIYNRIAIDVAAVSLEHVRLDDDRRYVETIDSYLNRALTLSANIDQTGRCLIQDIAMSMCDEGCVAVVPVDTTLNPTITDAYDIETLRTGKIVQWYPENVRVRLYNQNTGQKQEITLPKKTVAIIENPLYAVMNESNSTLQRLISKLNILDAIDQQSGSGKLDLLIQLPYVIKSPARKEQAEQRRQDIENQLAGSRYGIAYTDGTEKVTQLNRPAENNLMVQIQYLTSMLYSQLSITESVLDGTADEATMINYYNRTVEPFLSAIRDEMKRKYLTQTAISQHQSIEFFRNPFKLAPVSQIADIADKFTRNAILSSNEMRGIIGYKPSDDPKADELSNKNLNQENDKISKENNDNQEKGDLENAKKV